MSRRVSVYTEARTRRQSALAVCRARDALQVMIEKINCYNNIIQINDYSLTNYYIYF